MIYSFASCNYCFKTHKSVEFLIEAPQSKVYICNECIEECQKIIDKQRKIQQEEKINEN